MLNICYHNSSEMRSFKVQISVEELLTLLSKLGVDLTNIEIRNTLINEFLPQLQLNRKELITSVLREAHFSDCYEGFEKLVRAIELKMEKSNCQKIYGIIAQEESGKQNFTKEEYMSIERTIRNIFKRHFHEYNKNYNLYPEFVHKMYSSRENIKNIRLIDFLAIYISSLEQTKQQVYQKVLIKK